MDTFLFQSGVFGDMVLVHCGICEIILLLISVQRSEHPLQYQDARVTKIKLMHGSMEDGVP